MVYICYNNVIITLIKGTLMKISIKNIFKNILIFFILLTSISAVAVLLNYEQNNSFVKVEILNTQKDIIKDLKKIDKNDVELALIQYNGKSTQLQYQINKLHELYKYDITGRYVLNNSKEYQNDLKALLDLIEIFNTKAYSYYKLDDASNNTLIEFDKAYSNLETKINTMIFQNINYDNQKLQFINKLSIITFLLVMFFSIWYYNRLKKIYADITYLQSPSASKSDHQIHTVEADAILIRMKRKPDSKTNPTNIDPVTKINNNNGLVNEYSQKKNFKESNFTSVCLLEVDNFSKTNRAFNQEFSQAVLKKIAYTISLFEQATDVIARTDYNQFTVVLSRDSKEKAFKDMQTIREAIAELKFATQTKVPVQITVSGGFIIKPNNLTLSNAMIQAKKILSFAQTDQTNRILQQRDMEGVKI